MCHCQLLLTYDNLAQITTITPARILQSYVLKGNTIMSSKPVGGFNLVLGRLYEDRWFNRALINHHGPICSKCSSITTLHRLEKLMYAFGKMTIKTCDVITCSQCLEEAIINIAEKPKKPGTKRNLAAVFAKLPKTIQQQILGGYKS